MSARHAVLAASLALCLPGPLVAVQNPTDVVSRAMRDELARSMEQLRLDTLPRPYFIAYRVEEIDAIEIAATLGSLTHSTQTRGRVPIVEVRVGDYDTDNTHFFSFNPFEMMRQFGSGTQLPLDDNYQEIRRQLWLATDRQYKAAVEQLSQKRASLRHQTSTEHVPDFARESTTTTMDVVPAPRVNRAEVEALVRALSAVFRGFSEIGSSEVEWKAATRHTRYVNSEGTSFERVSPWITLVVRASTQAPDGMALGDAIELFGGAPSDLPGEAALADSVRALGARLVQLRRAPVADTYNGPMLFEGQAAGQIFDLVFARQLAAARQPVSDNPMFEQLTGRFNNPFLDKIGRPVLPSFLSVTDDPTISTYQGHFLGGFHVDDDGVRPRVTKLVDHGILKTLLSTRDPVRGIVHSTGNRWGSGPTIGTLLVGADSGLSDSTLRDRLLKLAAARGYSYGVVVRRIGGPSFEAFDDPMAFVTAMSGEMRGEAPSLPTSIVVKLFPDGREEPMRNGEIQDINATSFKDIVAVSAETTVYTAGGLEGPADVLSAFSRIPFANLAGFSDVGLEHARSYVVPSVLFEDVSLQRPRGTVPAVPLVSPPWASQP